MVWFVLLKKVKAGDKSNSIKPMQDNTIDQLTTQILKKVSKKNLTGVKAPQKKQAYEQSLKQIADLRGRPLFYPYISSGRGQGPYVELLDGSVKLDFVCGIGPHILGHSNPDIIKACLKGAVEDVVMQGHLQVSEVYKELLESLIKIASKRSRLTHAWFCPSGSMANENALKVLRQKHQEARKILAFEKAFAGRTTLMCEITDNPNIKQGLPVYDEVLRVPFSPKEPSLALKALKSHWEKEKSNIAVFMMELMQGDGGYFIAPRDFFVPLLEFCKSKSIAVWFDEVQTFARSGQMFAFETLGLGDYVDVCTIGKTLNLSASLWTKEYNPKPGLVSGTFSGANSSFHSALVILDKMKSLIEQGQIEGIAKAWSERLKKLEEEGLLSNVQGWGLMWGATPKKHSPQEVNELLQKLFHKGLICFSCGQGSVKRLRFLLPAVLEESHLDEASDILKSALTE